MLDARRKLFLASLVLGVVVSSCGRGDRSSPSQPGPRADGAITSDVLCLGPKGAKAHAVYLHGVDSPSHSAQEQQNRRVLSKIADELSLRIAVPRATERCPAQPDALCWGWSFDEAERKRVDAAVHAAAKACFAGEPAFGRIGFSNGGYALTQLFRRCEAKDAVWVLTVGAAMLKGPLEPAPERLEGCGTLAMLVGTGDEHNFDPRENYEGALRAKGADVRSVRYPGGHLLVEGPTRDALRALLSKAPTR